MNQDFVDLLRAFDHDVRFLIVGAYALGVHGRPRATGDLGIWVDATPEAWPSRVRAPFEPIDVDVVDREAFIRNKRTTGPSQRPGGRRITGGMKPPPARPFTPRAASPRD